MDGRRKGEEEARRASKGLLSALEVGWRWVGGLGLLSALAGEGGEGVWSRRAHILSPGRRFMGGRAYYALRKRSLVQGWSKHSNLKIMSRCLERKASPRKLPNCIHPSSSPFYIWNANFIIHKSLCGTLVLLSLIIWNSTLDNPPLWPVGWDLKAKCWPIDLSTAEFTTCHLGKLLT